jgi:hypothetical protein
MELRRFHPQALVAVATLLAAILLAGCGELPQPFRHEGINRLAIPTAPRGVVVRPVDDAPFGPALAESLVGRLLEAEVAATTREAAPGSWVLTGEPTEDGRRPAIRWTLVDGGGAEVASYMQAVPAAALVAADARTLKSVATEVVSKLSGPLHGELALEDQPPAILPPSVKVVPPLGLPGDGSKALAQAMRRALLGYGLILRDDVTDFVVTGRATVNTARAAADDLDVAWVVTAVKDGAELGVAQQAGAVPKGKLGGAWGSLAADIAAGGAEGVIAIVRSTRPR